MRQKAPAFDRLADVPAKYPPRSVLQSKSCGIFAFRYGGSLASSPFDTRYGHARKVANAVTPCLFIVLGESSGIGLDLKYGPVDFSALFSDRPYLKTRNPEPQYKLSRTAWQPPPYLK